MTSLFLTLPIALAASTSSAADSGFPISETSWSLSEVDGAPYEASATVAFPEEGRIAGKAACNNFTGSYEGTTDGFTLGPMAMTKMMCPDIEAEDAFMAQLALMTHADVTEDQVILSNADGAQMVFVPASE